VAAPETIQPFDPYGVEVVWSESRWRLTVGGRALKDFGRHEAEVRQAQRLIRDLRLTEYGTVGAPAPVMEYWLSDGQAPQGRVPGLRTLPIDQASLRVERAQGQWCVRDHRLVLFNFGPRGDEARQALAVLRKYGFTQVGVVGQLSPSMYLFLADPTGRVARPAEVANARVAPATKPAAAHPGDDAAKLQARFPAAEGFVAPAVRPLHAPDRLPDGRAAFGTPGNDLRVAGHGAANGPWHGAAGASPDRVPFDWRRADVRKDADGWKVVAGDVVLADFGPSEADARTALAVVRYYRPTEQVHVGHPAAFTYYLVNGQAPRGAMLGVPHAPFQPDALEVRAAGGGWAVCAGGQPLVDCGPRREDADDFLVALRRHRFDRLLRVGGEGAGGLTLLARSR
jgi:hypothetical protein